MTDPATDQPQPVTRAAHLAGLVSGAFVAVAGLVFWFKDGGFTSANLAATGNLIALAVTAVLGVAAYAITLLHGKNAADVVTPLAAPRDHMGRRLVPEGDAPEHAPSPAVEPDNLAEQWEADFEHWKANRFPPHDTQETPAVTEDAHRIPEQVIPGRRLGRHVRHDPRSLNYLVEATGVSQTKVWDRKIPILDQGNLGSCTGNATTGVLGTLPYYETLTAAQQKSLSEKEAVTLYSLATALDSYSGSYPPDDTGSDGLSVAKAAQQAGFISGYKHITSVDAAKTAILTGPFIVGTDWLSGMDNPDANGLVHATGSVRGGHEYECIGYHADTDLWEFCNSWGSGWGVAGHFFYSSADFAKLLASDGDATTFVPLAVTPQPVPPTPPPIGFPLAAYDTWRAHPRSEPKTAAFIAAADAWLAGGGV